MDIPFKKIRPKKQINVWVDEDTYEIAQILKTQHNVKVSQFAQELLKNGFIEALNAVKNQPRTAC